MRKSPSGHCRGFGRENELQHQFRTELHGALNRCQRSSRQVAFRTVLTSAGRRSLMACRSAADGRSKLARIHSVFLHRSQRIRMAPAGISPRSRCKSAGAYQRFTLQWTQITRTNRPESCALESVHALGRCFPLCSGLENEIGTYASLRQAWGTKLGTGYCAQTVMHSITLTAPCWGRRAEDTWRSPLPFHFRSRSSRWKPSRWRNCRSAKNGSTSRNMTASAASPSAMATRLSCNPRNRNHSTAAEISEGR